MTTAHRSTHHLLRHLSLHMVLGQCARLLGDLTDRLTDLPVPSGPPSWAVLTDEDPAAQAKVQVNRTEIALSVAVTPDGDEEVARTAGRIARTLGVTRGRALAYCDVGTMLTRMPATAAVVATGAFSFDLLRILADVTCAVDAVHVAEVDGAVAARITPVRAGQAVPGPRVLRRQVTEVVTQVQPSALPVDPEEQEVLPVELQPDFTVDTRDDAFTVFHVTLPADEATGAVRIIDAVAGAHGVSRASAFSEVLHGTVGDVSVTLNCYRNLDTGTMHLENRWLSTVATDRWMRRVTALTVPSHSAHDGRFATAEQNALLAGIDGTCRAPGCEHPAADADTDHVHRYDDDALPADHPPRTDTEKMQRLCRGCHNAKTRGLSDYTRYRDGTTCVTSIDDGHTVVTVPTGPLANAVLTFDQRLARRTRTRAEHRAALDAHRAVTAAAAGAGGGEPPF